MKTNDTGKGRFLNDYRLVYISGGEGTLSFRNGRKAVGTGTVVLLRPGLRYHLAPKSGSVLVEHGISFNGQVLAATVRTLFPEERADVFHVGINDEIASLIRSAKECADSGQEYSELLFTATVNHLLALVKSASSRREGPDGKAQQAVRYAKAYLREHAGDRIDLQSLAEELGMSYSWFRRIFREHTGTAPAQFLQAQRISRAKDLLLNTDNTVKDISADCGFTTPEYFCNVFRESTGMSPLNFRESLVQGEKR